MSDMSFSNQSRNIVKENQSKHKLLSALVETLSKLQLYL